MVFWHIHAEQEIFPGIPYTFIKLEVVVIPAGETHNSELVDGSEDQLGDWNMYLWVLLMIV